MSLLQLLLFAALGFTQPASAPDGDIVTQRSNQTAPVLDPLDCDCTISQDGNSWPISALQGNQSAPGFYSYGSPIGSSANTGLEISNALILFLYEDLNTGEISIFLIADAGGDGDGGTMEFELNCLPSGSYVSVSDDPGEFNGAPPTITGTWSWAACCTDGGVVSNIGCDNTFNVDLLLSTGIDQIIWYTGDINNPTQIQLGLTGEIITINCGGSGVCCPLSFDTEADVTDATCPETPDGSIDLTPQDGMPPYVFEWSNGENTEDIFNLVPGTYTVTITDAQGCMEEIEIVVDVSPGPPDATTAMLEVCSPDPTAVFDLTSVNSVVNLGLGYDVIWYENMDMTGEITNPSAYETETTIVYAFVDNGSCFSEPQPIDLIVLQSPIGIPTSMLLCEESNGMATFDLTTLDATISNGQGPVFWYLNAALTNPISDPTAFTTGTTTVFAVIDDGQCVSEAVEVELTVHPKPTGDEAEAHMCGDEFDEAVFDLTILDVEITIGGGFVEWFFDSDLTLPIPNPTVFQTATTTVFAAVFDGTCYSDPIPVDLIIDVTPIANPISIEMCDDGSGIAVFNLWDHNGEVSMGNGSVDWWLDEFLTETVPDPGGYETGSTTVWATVDNGLCISDPVPVMLIVTQGVSGTPASIATCAEPNGEGIFDLTSVEDIVSNGNGNVTWFSDSLGNMEIGSPGNYQSPDTTVYAQFDNGECVSQFIPVSLDIISAVTATPADLSACDDGSGNALFDLGDIAPAVSSGSGTVNWYIDPEGAMPITPADSFYSGNATIYANVTAGGCVSDTVPVNLLILEAPTASDLAREVCGDSNSIATIDLHTLDTLVSNNTGTVTWYSDTVNNLLINSTGMFVTGDTVIFATVNNGACTAGPVTVDINVLEAVPVQQAALDLCIPPGDTLNVDLTALNTEISGGIGTVQWFDDQMATSPIATPGSFPTFTSITVFANVQDGTCTSETVPVDIQVLAEPEAQPVTLERCADSSGTFTFNLTAAEVQVSNGTGTVTWFTDITLTDTIQLPGSYTSTGQTLYAMVTNGFCISEAVPVTLSLVDNLTANSILIEECVLGGSTTTLDLTGFEALIGSGSGTVIWFSDSLGIDTISDPSSFNTDGDTIYALVAQEGCFSNLASIPIHVGQAAFPLPQCEFTTIDSVGIAWNPVAGNFGIAYAINGQWTDSVNSTGSTFSLGDLAQGDTVTFWVTALYDSICTTPLTNTIACITDVCPNQTLVFTGLGNEYCRDVASIDIGVSPPGGILSGNGISGNTLFPGNVIGNSTTITYTWEDITTGCIYDHSQTVEIFDPLSTPVLNCTNASYNSVEFDWLGDGSSYGYRYSINQGPDSPIQIASDNNLTIDGLQDGDEVTLTLWAIGPAPCGNSDTVTITCFTEECPNAIVTITDPGIICSDDDPFPLEVVVTGLGEEPQATWSGPGITDPSGMFDPGAVSNGNAAILVTVDNGSCFYDASIDLVVLPQPEASFEVSGVPCLDSNLFVQFTGTATQDAVFEWALDGADVTGGNDSLAFEIGWATPGMYALGLQINDNGCLAEAEAVPVQVDAPLDIPVVYCMEEDYYSLTAGWDPVAGATSYDVLSSLGAGTINGNSFVVTQLPDDTTVTITVTAIGNSACGPVSSSIDCQTLLYIPPLAFIPNIFSPNGDGVNDIFYIQANEKVREVTYLRIYDRWGELVYGLSNFQPNNPNTGWDGTRQGRDLEPAVFVYIAELETEEGIPLVVKGDVTLVR